MEDVIDMAKLVKIDFNEVQNFYNETYVSQASIMPADRDKKDKIEKSSLDKNGFVEEDETSIYEYDYDCIKKSGFLDCIKRATAK